MSATVEKTAECVHGVHHQCEAPAVLRRKGAPKWEAPLMTLRCGCTCHRQTPRAGRAPQAQ